MERPREDRDKDKDREKHHKKHKKEKKEKRDKREKKEKREKKDKGEHGGSVALREAHVEKLHAHYSYMSKQHEFALWLREERNVFPDDVADTEALHRLFALFVRDWNNGSLPAKYAAGVNLAASARTAHRWAFVEKVDPLALGGVVDEVDKATHADTLIRVAAAASEKKGKVLDLDVLVPVRENKRKEKQGSDSEDSEDRRKREREDEKRDAKKYLKRKDAVMEEIVPKATGKDAQLEKKKQESAYHRGAGDDAQADLEAFDPYGEGPSIKARIARDRQMRQKQADAKVETYHKALADYKAKEDAKMAQFTAMLGSGASGGFASGGTQRFGV